MCLLRRDLPYIYPADTLSFLWISPHYLFHPCTALLFHCTEQKKSSGNERCSDTFSFYPGNSCHILDRLGCLPFSCKKALKRGVEIRKVAVLEDTMIKDLLKYLVSGTYLIIEVYDKNEKRMFEITQNELSNLFQNAPSPYLKMYELHPKNSTNV